MICNHCQQNHCHPPTEIYPIYQECCGFCLSDKAEEKMSRTQTLKQLLEGIRQEALEIEDQAIGLEIDVDSAKEQVTELRTRLENIFNACAEALKEVE